MVTTKKGRKKKKLPVGFKIIILAALIAACVFLVPEAARREVYPTRYDEYVEQYSEKYNIDKYFIYAIIKTESNFNENAVSEVGARGLMQIMEDAYEWVKYRISDDRDITYEQMYEAKYNIEYGCFMLGYYYEKYNSYELAAAAYHSGMGQVDKWIGDGTISLESFDVNDIPASKTFHYIKKVMLNFKAYSNLYQV